MIRTIHLHGQLAKKYSEEPIHLDVDDFIELMNGLECVLPGFRRELRKSSQMAVALKSNEGVRFIDENSLGSSFGFDTEIHIATDESGSGAEIATAIVSYMGWTSTAAYIATYIAVTIAIAYVAGAVAQSLAEKPDTSKREGQERTSALFDQAVNLQGQGHPVPLLYGRFKCGSVVISSDVRTEKNAIATDDTIQVTSGETATGNIFSNDIDGGTLVLTNFVVAGVTRNPGETYTASGQYTVTIGSNGAYTITTTAPFIGDINVTYTASSSTTPTASARLVAQVTSRDEYYTGGGY